jgi:hypothetical protein
MNTDVVDNVKKVKEKEWEKRCNHVEEILRRVAGYPKIRVQNSPYIFQMNDDCITIRMNVSEYERFRTEWSRYRMQLHTRGVRVKFPSLCERVFTLSMVTIILEFDHECRYF